MSHSRITLTGLLLTIAVVALLVAQYRVQWDLAQTKDANRQLEAELQASKLTNVPFSMDPAAIAIRRLAEQPEHHDIMLRLIETWGTLAYAENKIKIVGIDHSFHVFRGGPNSNSPRYNRMRTTYIALLLDAEDELIDARMHLSNPNKEELFANLQQEGDHWESGPSVHFSTTPLTSEGNAVQSWFKWTITLDGFVDGPTGVYPGLPD